MAKPDPQKQGRSPTQNVADAPVSAGVLDYDAPCGGCGYNLRGLKPEGKCPECQRPIADSLRGPLLRYADRNWLIRARRGMKFMYSSVLSVIVCFLCFIPVFLISAFVFGRITEPVWFPTLVSVGGVLLSLLILFTFALYPIGCWWWATPDPGAPGEPPWRIAALRYTGLILLPVFALWSVLTPMMVFGVPAFVPAFIPSVVLNEVISHACLAIVWLHAWLLVWRMDHFIQRCKSYPLKAKKTYRKYRGYATWGGVILLALHWLWMLLMSPWVMGKVAPVAGIGTQGMGSGFPLLAWLGIVGLLVGVNRAVGLEALVMIAGAPEEHRPGTH